MKSIWRASVLWTLLALTSVHFAAAQQQDPILLYTMQPGAAADSPLPAHQVTRSVIDLHPSLTDRDFLSGGDLLQMPAGSSNLSFRITRISRFTPNTYSVIAKSTTDIEGFLTFTIEEGFITGNIHMHEEGEWYQLGSNRQSGSNYLASVDPEALDILSCPAGETPQTGHDRLPGIPQEPAPQPPTGADQNGRIDLLILYTNDAHDWMEGFSSVNAYIAQIVNRSQMTLDNSNIDLELNVVHTARTSYDENPFNTVQTLNDLTDTNDGDMDEAHSLRDTHKADLVTLLADISDYGGYAWILDSTSGTPSRGFSVNRVQQLYFTYTFAHEIGHNMGNHHSRNQSSSAAPSSGGLKQYSTGWRWTGNNGTGYSSVMTYPEGDTEVPYFSDPNITYQGVPTGSYSGVYAPADNARSMREIQDVIANYRIGDPNPPPPPPQPPGPPSLVDPSDGETGVSRTPTLDWTASSGASSYRVQVATSSGFGNLVVNQSTSSTSYTVTSPLNFSDTYYWRVRASNSNGNSNWSSTWGFTTTHGTPSTPQLSSPSDGDLGTERSPELRWAAADRANSYTVQISTSSSFGTTVVDESLTGTSYQVSNSLEYLTDYYWRIRASNGAGNSNWSDVWTFTTTIPPPGLNSPADGQSSLPRKPLIDWTGVQEADFYRIQIARDDQFSDLEIGDSTGETQYRPSANLEYLTTYYWRVRSRDFETGITSDWSPARNFTTVIAPPEDVSVNGPADNDFQIPVKPTLEWETSDRAAQYEVQISTSEDFTEPVVDSSTDQTSFTPADDLQFATIYYWRVRAVNKGGTSDWSRSRSFTTVVSETKIAMNYPNPFRGNTTIRYQIAEQTDVLLEVYNSIGQKVYTLVDEQQEPRVYNQEFDAFRYAAGVYMVRLVTDNDMDVLSMTLVK